MRGRASCKPSSSPTHHITKGEDVKKPSEKIAALAAQWAKEFMARYPGIPLSEIRLYAAGLARKSMTETNPVEALWCSARASALRSLLKEQ